MSGMFSSKAPAAQKPTPINGLQVQTSSYGLPVALRYGRNRGAGQLIDYVGFRAIEHAQKQKTGGKGGPKPQTTYTYTYKVTFILALGEGAAGFTVNKVWKEKETMTLAASGLTLKDGAAGQTPWAYMQSSHASRALAYAGTAYVGGADYDLGDNAALPNFNFDISGLLFVTGKAGAKPSAIITDYLTHSTHGAGFNFLDTLAGSAFDNYCLARGIYLSPFEETQRPAANFVREMADACNSGLVWTQGKLKIIPYGDEPITGTDGTYTPDMTPLFNIGPDDFGSRSGANGGYVTIERKPLERAYNHIRIECRDKDRDYVNTIVEAKDQADIDARGLRSKAPVKMEFITDPVMARDIAQHMLQRELYVRRTFMFDLTIRHSLLDLMDLITITDPVNEVNAVLARVIGITEQADGLQIEAEEVLANAASAPRYTTQNAEGHLPDFGVAPGSTGVPMLINAPALLCPNGYELWIGASGTGANWGGAQVWVSENGLDYAMAGYLPGPSRIGTLNASVGAYNGAAATTVDTSNTIDVTLTHGALYTGTDADRDEFRNFAYLEGSGSGGEFISFKTATLTSALRYTLSSLRRAAYGTTATSKASGTRFLRLDDCIFRFPYDPAMANKTLYVKLPAFNKFGQAQQSLADATAYTVTLKPNTSEAPVRQVDLGGAGVNLIPDQYSTFEASALPPLTVSNSVAYSRVTDGNSVIKNSLYLGVGAATVWFGGGFNIALTPGKRYIVSFWARSSQANNTFKPFIEVSGSVYYYGPSLAVTAANTFQRVSAIIDLTASTATTGWFGITKEQSEAAYIDGIMVEEAYGTVNTPSTYVRGTPAGQTVAALTAAQNAQSTADGIVDIWPASSTAPAIGGASGAKNGDYWRDLSANGRWKVCDGTSWVDATDSRLPQALTDAANAQSTANRKIRLFIQETQPTAEGTGDQWLQSSTGITKYWSGTAWSLLAEQVSNSADVLVVNPGFEAGTHGWTLEVGWSHEQSTNAAFRGLKGVIHAGSNIAGGHQASRIYSTQGFPVKPGQRLFFSAMVNNVSNGANGNMLVGLLWYNKDGSLIAETNKDYNSSGMAVAGTNWKTVSGKVTAPRNAVTARVQAFSQSHTNGYYAADDFRVAYVDDVTEAPVNGTNLIPNSNFSSNEGLWPTGIYEMPVNEMVTDGWFLHSRTGYMATTAGAIGLETSSVNGNYRQLFMGDQGGTMPTGSSTFYTATTQKFQVVAGQKFAIDYRWQVDSAAAVPAGVARYTYMGLWGYDKDGSRTWFGGRNEAGVGAFSGTVVVDIPTNVVMVQGIVGYDYNNTTGGNVTMPWAVTHARFQNFVVRRVLNLDSGAVEDGSSYARTSTTDLSGNRIGLRVRGSRQIMGGARNMRPSQVMGFNAVRSTTALSADSAGNVTVNAHTVDINGEAVTYNAVTNAVTGLTQGTTYSIYCVDLYLDGGTRTWYATTNQYTVQRDVEGSIFAGNITIPSSGSSSGGTGGGLPSDCVDALSLLPCGRRAGDIKPGDFIACWDYNAENPYVKSVEVESNHVNLQPCIRITTTSGADVVASESTPMTLCDGRTILIGEMLGELALVRYNDGTLAWERVVSCVSAGSRPVAHIRVKQHCYFAGTSTVATIATHNPTMKP